MLIAFTYNLQTDGSEAQAEFDSPATIERLTEGLTQLGHQVEQIEVSGSAARVAARLEALRPDLVFNTAEGSEGRFREAFFPALFEQLGLSYTGSDPYACAITLDKELSKQRVEARGVRVPTGRRIGSASDLDSLALRFPVIAKPNFEGSSKGISQSSVVSSRETLRTLCLDLLKRYPEGVLVEEYIEGVDVTVPYLGGALTPCVYEFPQRDGPSIYDDSLKQERSDQVSVRLAQDLSESLLTQLKQWTEEAVDALSVADLARVDFRLSPQGELYFLEVNALPSLEPGASLYLSAAEAGYSTVEEVLARIVELAQHRRPTRKPSEPKGVTVGLAFNLKRSDAESLRHDDAEAEFDSPTTVAALKRAIEESGFRVVELEATPDFAAKVAEQPVDLVFNIAEGLRGKNREAQVPSILELLNIPYTGSDPATLCLTLDKGLAKRIVAGAGVPTPGFLLMKSGQERLPKELEFPLMVKPLAEGSSKGVTEKNVVETEIALRAVVAESVRRYRQPALVEQYVGGREFTVGVIGDRRLRVLPIMEIVFASTSGKRTVYSFEHKLSGSEEVRFQCPAEIDRKLQKTIETYAKKAFRALGCRDVARIDFRMDDSGQVHFIECNPLPGLTPGYSDLCVIAEKAGWSYAELVRQIMAPALGRLRAQR